MLERLALEFEVGVRYPEREVNRMLERFHPDYAALRRYLVDDGFLSREHGEYWRIGGLDIWPSGHQPERLFPKRAFTDHQEGRGCRRAHLSYLMSEIPACKHQLTRSGQQAVATVRLPFGEPRVFRDD